MYLRGNFVSSQYQIPDGHKQWVTPQLRTAKYCHCERSEAISRLGDCFPAERGISLLAMTIHSSFVTEGLLAESDVLPIPNLIMKTRSGNQGYSGFLIETSWLSRWLIYRNLMKMARRLWFDCKKFLERPYLKVHFNPKAPNWSHLFFLYGVYWLISARNRASETIWYDIFRIVH